ncbi:HTH_Tnp_Tc3_2 domain-containing protein [Trichonephila clavipes]|nr:HTH_Tnp_Tc3_2 domain-containing protein [Trichonephila clavipes]
MAEEVNTKMDCRVENMWSKSLWQWDMDMENMVSAQYARLTSYVKTVTPKCLGGPSVDRGRLNAHAGSRVSNMPTIFSTTCTVYEYVFKQCNAQQLFRVRPKVTGKPKEGMANRRGRSHAPQCTTSREDSQIVRMAVMVRSVTSRTVAQHIQSVTHHSLSARTIRCRLQQSGLSA